MDDDDDDELENEEVEQPLLKRAEPKNFFESKARLFRRYLTPAIRRELRNKARCLYRDFRKAYPQYTREQGYDWQGVTEDMLPLIEDLFKVKINVYEKKLRRGSGRYPWITEIGIHYTSNCPNYYDELNLATTAECDHADIIQVSIM